MIKYYLAQIVSAPPTLPTTEANQNTVQNVVAIVFAIFGALAFLVIVVAGFLFVTSAGDPQKTARARNAIIYAAVGLALSAAAGTIVYFILGRV